MKILITKATICAGLLLNVFVPAEAGWLDDFSNYYNTLSANNTAVAKWDISNCGWGMSSLYPTHLNHQQGDVKLSHLKRSSGLYGCVNDGSIGKSLELNYGFFGLSSFKNNEATAIKISITLSPHQTGHFSSLSFSEKQKRKFLHGRFKYYGIRVLKDGVQIYKSLNHTTTTSWSNEFFDFANNPLFSVTKATEFTVEILPYKSQGWNAFGALWAIDEIAVNAHADSTALASSCASGFQVDGFLKHPKFVTQLPHAPKLDAREESGATTIQMRQSCQWLGLYGKNGEKIYSTVWGYSQEGKPPMHMGPTIVTYKNESLDVRWENKLPDDHLFEYDQGHGRHMAHPKDGRVPGVVHLHGGHSEPESDGFPTAWYTRDFNATGDGFNEDKEVYTYHNTQEAAPLWYHDHVIGMTRLSVNAGLAGMYLLRDDNELSLDIPTGKYEREIMLQDIQLNKHGQLARNLEFPAFYGDYQLVNGVAWPVLDVEPRKYRFRLLNASDSRFYDLKMNKSMKFIQIGTDGGLIEQPIEQQKILMGPGERYDVIVDFAGMEGKKIDLINTEGILSFLPLLNPAMKVVMRFNVGSAISESDSDVPNDLRESPIVPYGEPDTVRKLLLGQAFDTKNNTIIDLLGTVNGGLMRWMDDITEVVKMNEVEEWEIYNTLLVRHPIHIHQVEFLIIDRQPIAALDPDLLYPSIKPGITPILLGQPRPPETWERGWKDEVIVPPLTRVRVRMRFDIPGDFVWHCHILTHEDHDMMRPLKVIE